MITGHKFDKGYQADRQVRDRIKDIIPKEYIFISIFENHIFHKIIPIKNNQNIITHNYLISLNNS